MSVSCSKSPNVQLVKVIGGSVVAADDREKGQGLMLGGRRRVEERNGVMRHNRMLPATTKTNG